MVLCCNAQHLIMRSKIYVDLMLMIVKWYDLFCDSSSKPFAAPCLRPTWPLCAAHISLIGNCQLSRGPLCVQHKQSVHYMAGLTWFAVVTKERLPLIWEEYSVHLCNVANSVRTTVWHMDGSYAICEGCQWQLFLLSTNVESIAQRGKYPL